MLTPAAKVKKGKKFRVNVKYEGKPTGQGWNPIKNGGFSATGNAIGATGWYPANHHPSDKATFTITATVPEGWQAVGNGEPDEPVTANGRTTFRWQEKKPLAPEGSTLAVDKFTITKRTLSNGLPAIFAYGTDAIITPESEDLLEPMLTYFGEKFGPYPFNSSGGIVVNAKGAFSAALETRSRPTYQGGMWDASMVHELSHAWWGDAVNTTDYRSECLAECFAQYANQLWDEHNGADLDKDFYQSMIKENRDKPEFWTTRLYDPGPGHQSGLYHKGSVMLHALRKAMGDEKFFALLKKWIADNLHRSASWPRFEQMAQEVAGKDLTGFFTAWTHSTTIPPDEYLYLS